MKRSKHTLSYYRMLTCAMGELVPVGYIPVLPGDTLDLRTEAVIRVTPLNTPVMHPVRIRFHHWAVPRRLTWPADQSSKGWEEFITGGADGLNSEMPPKILTTADKKSLLTYLGGAGMATASSPKNVNAFAVRAVNLTYNQRYRDQDICAVRNVDDITVPNIAWEKSYFTVMRPWTQKGAQVSLPIGTKADVKYDETEGLIGVKNTSGTLQSMTQEASGEQRLQALNSLTAPSASRGLYADLENSTQIDINAFRAGFALQRYQEARARYGSRFTEYLRYLGITPSDARLQEPEYLGGSVSRLNFSEVLQTTPATEAGTNGVGDLYGHGIAGVRGNRIRKFFEEHCDVITLMSVRPKEMYTTGIDREWRKSTKEDYFQRELQNLGQQEVKRDELFLDTPNTAEVIGYTDRYEEYRRSNSRVSQDFADVLNSWHLSRELPEDVALNQSFIDCKPSDRIYQVKTNDPLWCMINHHAVARRMVSKRANPRVL